MPSLPETPLTLNGGCFCGAITYTINVPELSSRPLNFSTPKTPIGPRTESSKRLPIITFDHCHSCRRIGGTLFQNWFICPQRWVQFELLQKDGIEGKNTGSENAPLRPSTNEFVQPTAALQKSTYLKAFVSSPGADRTFCGRCGTTLTFNYSGNDDQEAQERWGLYLDIALGTLSNESLEIEGIQPTQHSWWGEGIGWVKNLLTNGTGGLHA